MDEPGRIVYGPRMATDAKHAAGAAKHRDEATTELYASQAIRDELRAALRAFDADVVDFRIGPTSATATDSTLTH